MEGYGNGDWEEVQSGRQYYESRPLDVIILAGYEKLVILLMWCFDYVLGSLYLIVDLHIDKSLKSDVLIQALDVISKR